MLFIFIYNIYALIEYNISKNISIFIFVFIYIFLFIFFYLFNSQKITYFKNSW